MRTLSYNANVGIERAPGYAPHSNSVNIHLNTLRELVSADLVALDVRISEENQQISRLNARINEENQQIRRLYEVLEQRFEQYIAEELRMEERAAFRNRVAVSSSLLLIGALIFIYSIMLLMVDKELSPKLTLLSIAIAAAGIFIGTREAADTAHSLAGNFSRFFQRAENRGARIADRVEGVLDDARQLTLTANASIQMLARSSNDAIVTLTDQISQTAVELRGTGREVATAIQRGINNGRFQPRADVNVVIRDNYTAAGVCLVM